MSRSTSSFVPLRSSERSNLSLKGFSPSSISLTHSPVIIETRKPNIPGSPTAFEYTSKHAF